MSRVFQPIASSTSDGHDITLCRILESNSGTAYDYELSNFVAPDKPGTIVIKDGDVIIQTITLTYDGSNNLTSVIRS